MNVSSLTKMYDGKVVVDHVTFEIPKGKVTSIIGPNGAGKSTVMSILARLLKKDGGTVFFEGKEISGWRSKDLSKRMSILTQTNNSDMKITVRELVAFGRFPWSGNRRTAADEQKIDEALSYMQLSDIQDQFIDELSGGQRQRAYIAMIIAQDTEYVLLDEPTNSLDIRHSTRLMQTVRRLSSDLGKTVVLVLHEINYAAFYSDYILAMKDGKISRFGPVEEVITKDHLKNLYGVDFEILQIHGRPMSIYY